MIVAASKYTEIRGPRAEARGQRTAVQTSRRPKDGLFLPTLSGKADALREWFWRELKDGGMLHRYFAREKARTPHAIRQVARLMQGFKQNPKSDFQRKATIPAKLYHRWKNEDEHFFDDDANLRSLKRDNPDLPVFVGPRQMPTTRLRKSYGAAGRAQPSTLNPQPSS